MRPAARVPIRSPSPAAPWSVPSDVLGRPAAELGPDVDQHAVGQPARLEVALEGGERVAGELERLAERLDLVGVRVVVAGGGDGHAAQGQAHGEHLGERGEPLGEVGVLRGRIGDRAGERGRVVLAGPQRGELRAQRAGVHGGARDLRHRAVAAPVRRPDPGGRVEHQRVDVAPHVARPEVVARRRVDGGDGHAAGRERRCERVVEREPLERVVGRADAVEVAAEPAAAQPRVQRAHLVEVARDEVRLVGVRVADGGHDGDLALPVQRRDRGRGRVPAQARVLGERGARAGRQGELRPQPR